MSFINSLVNGDGHISDLATASRALQRALSPSSQTIIKYAKAYIKSRQKNRNIKHGADHYEVSAEGGRGAAGPASELIRMSIAVLSYFLGQFQAIWSFFVLTYWLHQLVTTSSFVEDLIQAKPPLFWNY